MRAALLCLFAVLFTANICNSSGNPCVCLKISNTILNASRVERYYLQKSGLCHITAVVITTKKRRTVCADPNKPWVIKAMELVDGRRRSDSTTARPTASERTVITQATNWDSSCCLEKLSVKNRRMKNFMDCKVQTADLCPFDAIIIRNRKGHKLCFDLQEKWVRENVVLNGTNTCDVLPKKNVRKDKKESVEREKSKGRLE